jgi:hypothetical protein
MTTAQRFKRLVRSHPPVSPQQVRVRLYSIYALHSIRVTISAISSPSIFFYFFKQRLLTLPHAMQAWTLTPEEPVPSPCSSLHSADSQICMTRWRALYQQRRRKKSRTGVLLLPNTLPSHPFSPQFRDT